ncbi:DedA family protein [Rhizobium sp. KVB221]|uniref:DedA family protein n=2 Tax=Rhizobium setariae TaxID=2801340 RepID=A0A937CP06_9HYPH|nr:DedA family protein [Rhizobium setariae]
MFESIGVPLPGESALIASALYAGSTHQFSIFAVVGVAALAAIIGDNIGYLIGRTVGHTLLERYGYLVKLTPMRLRIGEYLFMEHGGKIVFFGRFIAFLRTFAALLAGANNMAWNHFLVMNTGGGILWASAYGFGAYLLGEQIHRFAGPIGLVLLFTAAIVILVGALFIRRHEKELERRAITALDAHGAHSGLGENPH